MDEEDEREFQEARKNFEIRAATVLRLDDAAIRSDEERQATIASNPVVREQLDSLLGVYRDFYEFKSDYRRRNQGSVQPLSEEYRAKQKTTRRKREEFVAFMNGFEQQA
jgi:hypothetical protein